VLAQALDHLNDEFGGHDGSFVGDAFLLGAALEGLHRCLRISEAGQVDRHVKELGRLVKAVPGHVELVEEAGARMGRCARPDEGQHLVVEQNECRV
jgi:hypothetical protein